MLYNGRMINGLLLVDKPAGISSFGVVARVRWIVTHELKKEHITRGYCHDSQANKGICRCKVKVGHTGTLDPAATGLLILAIGSYTKKVPELIKKDKTYEVAMRLGQTSTTGDSEGEIGDVNSIKPSKSAVIGALKKYTGELMQTPPIFSAIKINGQRAYNLARRGERVEIEPRLVKVYGNELIEYRYPEVKFTSKVGSGTYIRSLVEDLGRELSTGAYMSTLRRLAIDKYQLHDAICLSDELQYEDITNNLLQI